jgi:pimeloyl-ACP methyl ester carboxylesterase
MIGNRRASPLLRVDFDNTHPDRIAGLVYLDAAYSYAFDNGKGFEVREIQKLRRLALPQPGPRILPASLRSGSIMSVCSGPIPRTGTASRMGIGCQRKGYQATRSSRRRHGGVPNHDSSKVHQYSGACARHFCEPPQRGTLG